MKSLSFLIVFLSLTTLLFSQKIYNTKSGKISFFSSTALEDIQAKNSAVESYLSSTTGQYDFVLNVKDFHFENDLMEEHFNEKYLESDKYPKAYFKGAITNIRDINFQKDGVYAAQVKGNLTIHGVTHEVVQKGAVEVKNGKPGAKSNFSILLKDYNVGGLILNKMISPTIAVSVDCLYD